MNKYYIANLYTSRFEELKSKRYYENDLRQNVEDLNTPVIIEQTMDNKTIEYRTKQELSFVYFDKIVFVYDDLYRFVGKLNKDAKVLAIAYKTDLPELTKEEVESNYMLDEIETDRLKRKIDNINRQKGEYFKTKTRQKR